MPERVAPGTMVPSGGWRAGPVITGRYTASHGQDASRAGGHSSRCRWTRHRNSGYYGRCRNTVRKNPGYYCHCRNAFRKNSGYYGRCRNTVHKNPGYYGPLPEQAP